MESLKTLMSLVDANSDKIPDGDYLAMCNALKVVHGGLKAERVSVRSTSYYECEEELDKVTTELARLHRERNKIHYRTKMTKHMKTEALRVFAFEEGLHSLREHTVEALEEAGVRVDCDTLFGKYLEDFNDDVYERKKAIHLMIEDERAWRDDIVRRMADL